jgi:DNA-binding response OmpR family regulator
MNELVLVVDDEPKIVKQARDYLARGGFRVIDAADGKLALARARGQRPDLIVLDLNLPQVDGLDVCRALRRESDVPIIMLTARVEEADRLIGLELGADDYITKPFSLAEVIARVQACLRRAESADSSVESEILASGVLTIDFARRKVSVRGTHVDLTPTEFRLLSYLARNRGRVVGHRTLLQEVWGPEYGDELDYLRLYVSYLRRKIEVDPANPEIIKTAWGEGYFLEED